MLDTTMKFDILVRLTPQISITICHHLKKSIIKKRKKNTNKYGEMKTKSI